MQLPKKNLFFYTDRDNLNTYVYFKNKDESNYKRRVYFPHSFETMTNQQIESYRKKVNFKFILWSFFNKDKITEPSDRRIVTSQLVDLNFALFGCASIGFLLFKFLRRMDAPFLELYMEDKLLNLNTLRLIASTGVTAYGLNYIYKNFLGQKFLYDIALEYKEEFLPNEITDSKIEGIVSKYFPTQKVIVEVQNTSQQQ